MKVLLVEDEEYTRNGIVRSIPWSELGIDEVVTAEDGQEGLSRALAEQPQIIITDMRMPRMNGHEMASIIRECLSDCSFIFISGFTDVSYFKSAISLSAVDYITKPIDIEELVTVLTSAIAIQNEKARDNRKNERNAVLILTQPDADLTLLDARYTIDPTLLSVVVCVATTASDAVESAIRTTAARFPFKLLLAHWNQNYRLIISCPSPEIDQLKQFMNQLSETCGPAGPAVVSCSSWRQSKHELATAFTEAQLALQRSFYHQKQRVFLYTDAASSLEVEYDPVPEFRRYLSRFGPEKTISWLTEQYDHIRQHDGTPVEIVQNWIFRMLVDFDLFRQQNRSDHSRQSLDKTALWSQIKARTQIASLFDLLVCQLTEIEETNCENTVLDSEQKIVMEAQKFIHNHFTESSLALNHIAEHVNISTSYLCSLYKSVTGQTVKQYLTHCRIQKARRMLETTRLHNHEISQQAGYSDSNYFVKSFRKHTGLTPQEYRREHSTL